MVDSVLALALRLPGVFDFGTLLEEPAVKAAKGSSSKAYELVELFATGGLKEWNAWKSGNEQVLEQLCRFFIFSYSFVTRGEAEGERERESLLLN